MLNLHWKAEVQIQYSLRDKLGVLGRNGNLAWLNCSSGVYLSVYHSILHASCNVWTRVVYLISSVAWRPFVIGGQRQCWWFNHALPLSLSLLDSTPIVPSFHHPRNLQVESWQWRNFLPPSFESRNIGKESGIICSDFPNQLIFV
jgi:hypothetical protein